MNEEIICLNIDKNFMFNIFCLTIKVIKQNNHFIFESLSLSIADKYKELLL